MKTVSIYILIDPLTNDVKYVGKTTNIAKRLNRHINESKKSTTSHKKAWIKSLLKRGLEPAIGVVDEILEEDWRFWESYWIEQFKCWGFNLTNETSGGDGVDKGNIPWNKGVVGYIKPNKTTFKKGNKIGKKTRVKKGERLSPKTEFKKGSTPWNVGIPRSNETKKKISEANKGKESKNKKTIFQYSMDMQFIKKFDSVKQASIVTGINTTSISQVARGERKKAGGYKWIYKNEEVK